MAVGRDVGHVLAVQVARTIRGHVVAIEHDRSAAGLAQAGDGLDQLVLAVAGHAGDAEDLAGVDLEVHAVDDVAAVPARHAKVLDRQHRPGGVAFAAVDGQLHLATDHQLGEVVFVGLAGDAAADDLASPDDRDAVGDLKDLVELVTDEDDAVSLGRQAPQHGEDLDRLLGREHRGRLVEYEDARIAIQRLEDLDTLLPTDREVADLLVGVQLETEPSAQLADATTRFCLVKEDRAAHGFLAEQDVVRDGQDRHQHEVLVDHADAAVDGIGRVFDVDDLAIEQDLTLVRFGQAVEDVHERRLAGAVLAQQGVDLARLHVEVDAVVGDHAGIALGDATHLERRRCHRLGAFGRGRIRHDTAECFLTIPPSCLQE